ncbi:hypothetical protein EJ06DRAFT_519420 [Trichodelitschia bisporula]|uniref:ferric-chelate reductase (NADPH) n=1 Tax=Trichodelitschia bisporula TaxID=703511 RepID=A0A6G1I6D7_9PEZI|nr:hypothetical protein EJ06DRAFT_519420 [Trichodelitschia bisporula]
MAFGFHFIFPDAAGLAARRSALDFHATVAQLSAVVVVALLQGFFLVRWFRSRWGRGDEESRPSSPYLKHEGEEEGNWARKAKAWSDYLHLTKRFAIIGASQLPLHYLLSLKSPLSPLQLLTRLSHEQLLETHQVLGRLIQILLTLHASFYLNFYLRSSLLAKRIKDADVALGLTLITLLTLLGTTALRPLRNVSYTLFYRVHIAVACAILPLAWFHVSHIRPYIAECALIFTTHTILRFLASRTVPATLTTLPGTSLLKISTPAPESTWQAGQHIFLRGPARAAPASWAGLSANPFTIASNPGSPSLDLIIRPLRGATKHLAAAPGKVYVTLEGPYGAGRWMPDWRGFDRVLLVAGGVGGTFIAPVWRSVLAARGGEGARLVWVARSGAEVAWAFGTEKVEGDVEVFITGSGEGREGVEMQSAGAGLGEGVLVRRGRPVWREVVDEVFAGWLGMGVIMASSWERGDLGER